MKQAMRMRGGGDNSATYSVKMPYMEDHSRRGVSEVPRRYEKDSQHESRSNGGHPPNPKD